MRSYRRLSSVSISDQAFCTALRWETNPLYESTTPSAMTTTMTMITMRAVTDVSFGAGDRVRGLGYRAWSGDQTPRLSSTDSSGAHQRGNALDDQRRRVEQSTDLGDLQAVRVDHQVLRSKYDVIAPVEPEQGYDHLRVDQLDRERVVIRLHIEPVVEIDRLESDARCADGFLGENPDRASGSNGDLRHRHRQRRDDVGERDGALVLPVGHDIRVIAVRDRESVPLSAKHVVPVAAVPGTEEREPAATEIPVISDHGQTVRSREGGDIANPLLPGEVRHKPDHDDEDEEDNEEHH